MEPERPEREIDLKNQATAAILAYLIPGAGHFYQGRTFKGVLYLVCILGTFYAGMVMGDWLVIEHRWAPHHRTIASMSQLMIGLPALPALIQEPIGEDALQDVNRRLGKRFDLAVTITCIAGLMNVLAVWDAAKGPAYGYGD